MGADEHLRLVDLFSIMTMSKQVIRTLVNLHNSSGILVCIDCFLYLQTQKSHLHIVESSEARRDEPK